MIEDKDSTKFTILDGKVHLFKRDLTKFWWTGFHHKGKYIRTSTKRTDVAGAEAFARQWYFQKQTEVVNNEISTPKHSFDKVTSKAIEHYKSLVDRGIRSPKTLEGIEGILNSRVIPHFQKTPISKIDNQEWHRYKEKMLEQYPKITRGSLHQHKNAIRVVLNEGFRLGYIKSLPVFKDEYKTNKHANARPWFDSREYNKLHQNILAHAKKLEKKDRLQYQHAMELYDYVLIATNTGMRVGELRNCRVCDVKIVNEKLTSKRILIISNIKGKRGTGICQSYYGAVEPFERILKRRNIKKPNLCEEPLFLVHHRVMFNVILKKIGLKFTKADPPVRRDFVSLRATYICFRLLNGVPIYEIANNCRTSVEMIENSYAKYLGGTILPNINKTKKDIEGWDY